MLRKQAALPALAWERAREFGYASSVSSELSLSTSPLLWFAEVHDRLAVPPAFGGEKGCGWEEAELPGLSDPCTSLDGGREVLIPVQLLVPVGEVGAWVCSLGHALELVLPR